MAAADMDAQIAELERLLKKREGRPGFSANVAEIKARLESARAAREAANGGD